MSNIFGGFLFIFLNFNLNINQFSVNLLPGFVGFLLCLNGIKEMVGEGPSFQKARPWAIALCIVDAIQWTANLVGVGDQLGILWYVIGLLAQLANMYFALLIIRGVEETSQMRGVDLNQVSLRNWWVVSIIATVVSYLLIMFAGAAVAAAIFAFVAYILFLVQLNKSKNLYKAVRNNG